MNKTTNETSDDSRQISTSPRNREPEQTHPTNHPVADSIGQTGTLPVEFFKTPNSFYVFDPGHIVFLEIDELTYNLLSVLQSNRNLEAREVSELSAALPDYSEEEIRESLDDIQDIKSQGFLNYFEFSRHNPYQMSDIKKHLNSALKSIYLNLTSKCNLDCSYCVYGGGYENFDSLKHVEMSWETAQKAIDFLLPKTNEKESLRIDFFGGEPLLAFPLMKRITVDLKERMKGRDQQLKFYTCTNGTVMSDDILDFLLENNVFLQISIDGDRETHDSNRKFKGLNRGSFDKIFENLQIIYDRDPDYFDTNVKLKSVITTDSLNSDERDFLQNPLIKRLHERKQITMINQNPQFSVEKDGDFFDRMRHLAEVLLQKRDISTLDELTEGLNFHMYGLFYMTFYEFFPIQIQPRMYYDREDPMPFTKDCLIGIEGCVNVDGSISVCYQANSFIIGNVHEQTWYYDKIEAFHTQRYSCSESCKHCFIQRFCNMCYEGISARDKGVEESIKNFCNFKRQYFRLIFDTMLQVMENNPNLWNVLQEMLEKEENHFKNKSKSKKEDNT
jgi:uncharacterized protein